MPLLPARIVFGSSYRELLGYTDEEEDPSDPSKVSTVGIMGHGAIGKTTLCRAIMGKDPSMFHPSTAGIEFHKWRIDDRTVSFADFGGQDIWDGIVKDFMIQLLRARLLLLAFDAGSPKSFSRTVADFHRWIDYLEEAGSKTTMVRSVVFVGCKIDEDNPRLISKGGMSETAKSYDRALREIVERVASPNQTQTLRLLHDESTPGRRVDRNVFFLSGLYFDRNPDYLSRIEALREEIKRATIIRPRRF